MVKRLRSVPAPQTMLANAVRAPVFGPISQVHVTLPTAFARAEPSTWQTNAGTNEATSYSSGTILAS
jgi:hypothetical protein